MTIFWSFKDIPELAELPRSESKKIWLKCYLKSFQNWQTWLGVIGCGLCTGFGVIIGHTISDTNIAGCIGAGIGGGISGIIFGRIFNKIIIPKIIRPYIREYIKSHGQESNE